MWSIIHLAQISHQRLTCCFHNVLVLVQRRSFFPFVIAGILIGAQASHFNHSALYCLHVVSEAFWLGLDIHFHLQ